MEHDLAREGVNREVARDQFAFAPQAPAAAPAVADASPPAGGHGRNGRRDGPGISPERWTRPRRRRWGEVISADNFGDEKDEKKDAVSLGMSAGVARKAKGGGRRGMAEEPRQRFVETAYWNPSVVTGKDGKATIKFRAPTALSEYRFHRPGRHRLRHPSPARGRPTWR